MDAYEFAQLHDQVKAGEMTEDTGEITATDAVEYKPHFHHWATVLPGMICLSRKARNTTFRNYVASETATPVIGCAAGLKSDDARNFFFAGICRSKTVRTIDDGNGPSVDEFFTLAIGGMATLLNNSASPVYPGDMIEWTLYNESKLTHRTGKEDVRRIGIAVASPISERVIGKCLSFAKSGETFDLLIKTC